MTTGCTVPCQGCTTNLFWCWKELILTFWFDDELWRQILVPQSLAGSLFGDPLLFLHYCFSTTVSLHWAFLNDSTVIPPWVVWSCPFGPWLGDIQGIWSRMAGGGVWFLGACSRVLEVLLGDYQDSMAVHGTGSTLELVPVWSLLIKVCCQDVLLLFSYSWQSSYWFSHAAMSYAKTERIRELQSTSICFMLGRTVSY